MADDQQRSRARSAAEAAAAWSLVGAQVGLLAALLLPSRAGGRRVPAELRRLGLAMSGVGLGSAVAAAAALGPGLTPSPLPSAAASLRTDGPYARVRHPVYTGLLLLAAGQVLRSPSRLRAACAAGLGALLGVKARWEEARMTARFPGYRAYAAAVPRFVPRLAPRARAGAARRAGDPAGRRPRPPCR